MGPLENVRVLALEGFIAGPYGSMLLADFGAEVIKVEPARGDAYRNSEPIYESDAGQMSYNFLRLNRNKHSIVLDLAEPEDRESFLSLVDSSDVVWENLRPGALDSLGLTWPVLSARNPRIILASVSGFGRDVLPSPYQNRPAFDLIAQAMSGLMTRVGDDTQPPLYLGVPLADQVAGLYAAFGLAVALLGRERTGRGQQVDVSMLDAAICLNEQCIGYYSHFGEEAPRGASPTSAPYAAYRAADGWLAIAIASDEIFRRFCAAIEDEELARMPEMQTGILRSQHRESILRARVEQWTASRSAAHAAEFLSAAGVPAGPVRTTADLLTDPHVAAREMLVEIDDPIAGRLVATGNPVKLSDCRHIPTRTAPQLGADQDRYVARQKGTALPVRP